MEKMRLGLTSVPAQRTNEIEIKYFAKVEFATRDRVLGKLENARAAAHLAREVIRERFDYDAASRIHLAFVRVFRLSESGSFQMRRATAVVVRG